MKKYICCARKRSPLIPKRKYLTSRLNGSFNTEKANACVLLLLNIHFNIFFLFYLLMFMYLWGLIMLCERERVRMGYFTDHEK